MKTTFWASISLLGGAMIYVLFRPTHLLMFNWIDCIGLMDFINSIKPNSKGIPKWIIYSLPDGLWMFSYCLFIGSIWDFDLKRCFFVLMLLPLYAISNEVMQFFHLVSGTFDWMDLIAYLTFFVLGLLYIVYSKNRKIKWCLIKIVK